MRRKSIFLVAMLALLAFGSMTNACNAGGVADEEGDLAVGTKLENLTLPDLSGAEQSLDKLKGENGAVLVWVSAQCPVVKAYNERINKIAGELKAKGINLIGINSNATESLDWVASSAKEVGYKFPVLIDKGNVLADKLGASVTPEFYYFDKENVLLYHGALDNDRSGKNVTTNYLRDAFDSALGKKPIKTAKTNAFGCSIKRAQRLIVRILSLTKQIGRGAENKFFRIVFFIGLCAFFSLVNSSCAQTKNPAQKSPVETKPRAANPPRVTQIDDAKIKQLLKPGGKPLLINFWATWCGPCREEFPDLVEINREYRGKIDFFTVSLDFIEEIDTGVPKFLGETKAEMPTYLLTSADENTLIASIAKDWSGGLPFTILYNEKGEITYTRQGKVNYETLKGEIEKTLGA